MIDEEKDGIASDAETEPEVEQDATVSVKTGGKEADPLAGLPLHLHPRGK